MPRTESRKKRSVRFCRDCGYELARDQDGPCPMCGRFEQFRTDFILPRPSDLAAYPAEWRDAKLSGDADGWPPTVAEYRAVLAERRLRLASEGRPAATVIRTPGLRQVKVAPPPQGAAAPGDAALTSPAQSKASKAAPGGQRERRREAGTRARSSPAMDGTTLHVTASPIGPPDSAVVAATPGPSAPAKAVEAQTATAVATGNELLAVPREAARPFPQVPVRRRASGSRTGATPNSLVAILMGVVRATPRFVVDAIVVVASAVIGAALTLLLS